jgi:hypothetical protein
MGQVDLFFTWVREFVLAHWPYFMIVSCFMLLWCFGYFDDNRQDL